MGNNGCFGLDNQILNAMALGNPDRERYCSICPTQAPWVPRSSQQRISSFSPDIPNASEYAEVSSMEVEFRRKSQDTNTIRVGFISNRSRKPVVASWTAAPSSSSSRPKYQDKLSSIQPLAFLYYYPLALNALNQQVIKPWEQVGPHKYFPARTTFRHGPIHVNLYPLHTPLGKRWFTIWPLGGTPFLAHKILLLSALHISFNKCIARYMFEQTLL
ncbi:MULTISPECIES: hypothetical protein [Bifidobacterium]|uniref:hypothetical protein n=1 Tax=Bifidobacterium TaxID=1678 RepID=UPI0018DB9E02|nr:MULTISPECIES: hypothetical protein [Bifidobacterium]MBI0145379.1 hypothetical protein [Bifidobacterium polysaccharolyticum]MBI0152201.1 hypothetical protein [Bifidobacterium sp. M0399]